MTIPFFVLSADHSLSYSFLIQICISTTSARKVRSSPMGSPKMFLLVYQ